MEDWFFTDWKTILFVFLSTAFIYLAVVINTRLFGKRSFSKMSSFDFACTIAIGSIIASTILTSSVSLVQGFTGLFSIYLLQAIVAYFRKNKHFQNMVDNEPQLLMDGTTILWENMKKARITEDDLRAKLREANVIELSQIKAVVFETTGDIAVLHSDQNISLDPWLLEKVDR